ncbi:MAG: CHASE2 domain-containing protein [Candidatus Omnitrophica bacterium]|nr:CHASE2 domain-containing protein [Candidatus Omnitrophota bacterium]
MKLRKNEHPIRLVFVGTTLAVVYLGILIPAGFLEGARLQSQDAYCRWRNVLLDSSRFTDELLLIAVDDESQQRMGRKWPWDRRIHAELLQKLAAAHPKLIHLDFVLSGAGDPTSDQLLAQAITAAAPVLLASYLDSRGEPVLPHPLFIEHGGLPGLINKPRDPDATVRRLFVAAHLTGRPEPLYAIEIAGAALSRELRLDQLQIERKNLRMGNLQIPYEPPGVLGINYLAPRSEIPTIPYWEALEGRVPPEKIRGKIVLVGRTASAAEIHHDVYPTPLGVLPGVLISANGILTLLSEQFTRPVPLPLAYAGGLVLAISTLLLTFHLPVLTGFLAMLLLSGSGIAAGFAGLAALNWQTESLSVFLLAVSAWLLGLLYKYGLLARQVLRLHRQVVTDPVSRLHTGRYFRLRLEETLRHRSRSKFYGLLVVRIKKPSEMLQQAPWEEARQAIRQAAQYLRSLQPGALAGQVEEDRLALVVPGLTTDRAEEWAKKALEKWAAYPDRLGFGLACMEVPAIPSAAEWIRCASSAADRSWARENRVIELYSAQRDGTVSKAASGSEQTETASPFDYVASELEEKNRALEKTLEELRKAHKELENHFLEVTKSLIMAMDTKDAYTAGHLERVSRYATRLAETLNLPNEEVAAIHEAALLHDIGKLNLPDEILHKTGRLTPEEVAIIRQHLELGAKILDPMKFFRPITTILYHHHERYDGKGYPHGLTGEFIPVGAQVISIVDSFDAMTTNRGYNKPMNVREALTELRAGAGTQFNPAYVEVFAKLVEREGPQLAGHDGTHDGRA